MEAGGSGGDKNSCKIGSLKVKKDGRSGKKNAGLSRGEKVQKLVNCLL
jgi:hypothetical protein